MCKVGCLDQTSAGFTNLAEQYLPIPVGAGCSGFGLQVRLARGPRFESLLHVQSVLGRSTKHPGSKSATCIPPAWRLHAGGHKHDIDARLRRTGLDILSPCIPYDSLLPIWQRNNEDTIIRRIDAPCGILRCKPRTTTRRRRPECI